MTTNSICIWQSAIISDTLRTAERKPSSGGWYELHFENRTPHTFTLILDHSETITSMALSTLLSSGHKKAGYQSISDFKFLREVQSVSVTQRKFDQNGNLFFNITLVPSQPPNPDNPLYTCFNHESDEEDKKMA
jgi:hypothetical protein